MFARLLQKGTSVFRSQQYTILSAAAVIGTIYGLSAILGFVKNRLLSGYFGDSTDLGVFFAADDIPSLIFAFLIAGSLSAAFIPVFTKAYKDKPERAWDLTASSLNLSLVLVFILAVVVWFGAEPITENILARNTSLSTADITLLAKLMRIMMIAQIIFIVSAFLTSVLQSFNHFVIPALAPVMYNLGQIIFIVVFIGSLGIYAPAYGMIFGALFHMAIQLFPARRIGYRHIMKLDLRNKDVREVYTLLIPRTIGQAANLFMIPLYTNLALFISASANVVLTFADTIQMMPVRIFGLSIGQAALPILSKVYNEQGEEKFKSMLIKTIYQVTYFILPVSVMIFVLKIPLVRLAVGAQKYSWEATVMTAYTLGFFSISLIAQALVIIFSRSFYALHNTKTPLKISLFALFVNAVLAIIYVRYMYLGVWSLALAALVGSTINCVFLFIFIFKKIGGIDLVSFLEPINRIGIATLLTGVALYIPLKAMDQLVFDTTRTIWLIVLTGTVAFIGFSAYLFLSWILKIKEFEIVIRVFQRARLHLIR